MTKTSLSFAFIGIIMLGVMLLLPSVLAISVNVPKPVPQAGGNYSINVNNTDNFGGYSITGYRTWLESWFCKLTGCTMTGNINLGSNNLTNVSYIVATNNVTTNYLKALFYAYVGTKQPTSIFTKTVGAYATDNAGFSCMNDQATWNFGVVGKDLRFYSGGYTGMFEGTSGFKSFIVGATNFSRAPPVTRYAGVKSAEAGASAGFSMETNENQWSFFAVGSTGDWGLYNINSSSYPFYVLKNNTMRFGNVTSYTEVSPSGTITLKGEATVFDDMLMPVIAGAKGLTNNPTLSTFKGNTRAYSFADQSVKANEEELFFNLQMSHSYKSNSSIEMHLHWACGTTSVNNVTWGLDVTKADINGVFGDTTTYLVTQSCGANYTHNLADFHGIGNFSGLSGVAQMRLFRASANATDNYAGNDAFAVSLDAHYEKDTLGSAEEYVK